MRSSEFDFSQVPGELKAAMTMVRKVHEAESREEAFEAASEAMSELGFGGVMVSDVDWDAKSIVASFASCGSKWEAIVPDTKRDLAGGDILAVVLAQGEGEFIPDSSRDPRCHQPSVAKAGIVSQYVAPLTTCTEKIGTLQVDCGAVETLSPSRVLLIEGLAANLALALEREILRQKATASEDALAHLERVAMAGLASTGVAHRLGHELKSVHDQTHKWLEHGFVRTNRDLLAYFGLLDQSLDEWEQAASLVMSFAKKDDASATRICSVGEAVQSAIALWLPKAAASKCRMEHNASEVTGTRVFLAREELIEILSCLLVNSMQAHARKISVSASIQRRKSGDVEGRCMVLGVTDDGEGVKADDADKLFRADFSSKPGHAGTGLGLPIARALARKCGGDVSFVSSKRYRETVFEVVLPLVKD